LIYISGGTLAFLLVFVGDLGTGDLGINLSTIEDIPKKNKKSI